MKLNIRINKMEGDLMGKYNLLIFGLAIFLLSLPGCQKATTADEQSRFEIKAAIDPPVIYQGEYLTGIDFPVGALGGSVIRMNGKAERQWWQIFNNFEERAGSGIVPNSFFAIRAKSKGKPVVRVLQTSAVGDFDAMDELTMQGEYPFGWYKFVDNELPVKVSMEAYNPLIPMDMKNSAIPCGIFSIKVSNPTDQTIEVSILGTQQNAIGFSGYDIIAGPNNRSCKGYGDNKNEIINGNNITSLKMTGNGGSMQLSVYQANASYASSWENNSSLLNDFTDDGGDSRRKNRRP
jgi:uncharacterized protein (DUF608 family)